MDTPDSAAISRCIRSKLDISREKKAVGIRCLMAMFEAIVMASAVFPMEGRAPMTISSEFWNPPVRLSRAVRPVAIPTRSL